MSFDLIGLVNVTMEAYALLVCAVLLLSMANGPNLKKRRVLLTAVWLQMLTLASDLAIYVAQGKTTALARIAVRVGLAVACPLAVLTCICIVIYVYTDASSDPITLPCTDPLTMALLSINAVNLVIAVSSPLTHACYVVTESNQIARGYLSGLSAVLYLAQLLLMFPAVARLHARHGTRTTIRLAVCGVLGLAAMIADGLVEGLMLLDPAVSLMLVILSVGVQGRLEEELERARADVAESRVRLLSGQIHPHFIFNSLTAIKELVSEDQELAERSIQDFSDYLRSHLDVMSATRLVPFSDEIEHVRHYVSLEQADATVPIEIIYDFEVEDFLVPPLTVQPLVENSIRHGIRTREQGGTVRISTRRAGGSVVVCVCDNGHGFSSATLRQSERQRVGIENVRERIERLCAGTLEVKGDGDGTVATITIPEETDL